MKINKGFTLAELLIVVSIISTLTGISIPVFNSQLEKSREATDLANVRNAYAEIMADAASGDTSSGYWNDSEGQYEAVVRLSQTKEGWQSQKDLNIAGITSSDSWRWVGHPMAEGFCEISYNPSNDKLTFNWAGSNLLTNLSYNKSGSWNGNPSAPNTFVDGNHKNDIFSTYNSASTIGGKLKGTYELEKESTYKVTVTYNPLFDDPDNPTMGVFAKATVLFGPGETKEYDSGTGTKFVYNEEIKKDDNLTYMYTKNSDGTITYTATFKTGSSQEKYYYGMNFGGMKINSDTIDKNSVVKFNEQSGFGMTSSEVNKYKEQVLGNLILEKID